MIVDTARQGGASPAAGVTLKSGTDKSGTATSSTMDAACGRMPDPVDRISEIPLVAITIVGSMSMATARPNRVRVRARCPASFRHAC
jgi:hypothetical protein